MYSKKTIPAYGARHDHYLHLVEAFGAFALLSLILRDSNPGKTSETWLLVSGCSSVPSSALACSFNCGRSAQHW